MQALQALTDLYLSTGSPMCVESLQPVFNQAVDDLYYQAQDDDGYNPTYYRLKKGSKSGWGGASCKHPLNKRPYTI